GAAGTCPAPGRRRDQCRECPRRERGGRQPDRRRFGDLRPGRPSAGLSPPGTSAGVNWMERALELAERGRGTTRPNPMVGAVVVKGDQVVGEGWHERQGGAHAEVVALEAAGEAARGATLYVTMEPCTHHGRTPPCTDAVLR